VARSGGQKEAVVFIHRRIYGTDTTDFGGMIEFIRTASQTELLARSSKWLVGA